MVLNLCRQCRQTPFDHPDPTGIAHFEGIDVNAESVVGRFDGVCGNECHGDAVGEPRRVDISMHVGGRIVFWRG